MANTSRLQLGRNRKAIEDFLQEFIDGTASETKTRVMLQTLGFTETTANELIDDARDGTIDTDLSGEPEPEQQAVERQKKKIERDKKEGGSWITTEDSNRLYLEGGDLKTSPSGKALTDNKKDASKKSEPKKTEKPSQPAEQKQKTKSTKIESGPRFDRHKITMESDGTGVGSLEMSHDKQKKTVEVRAIDAIQKGQGVGVKLYGAAMEQAVELGAEKFGSDFKVSDSAYKSWQRLKESLGDAVKENPSKNNGNQREGDGPIFEVDLSKLSTEQIKKLKEQGTK
jgi:hypothetical protein